MQAQIYYDLGDYDKSVAIANELHAGIEVLDAGMQFIGNGLCSTAAF